MRIAPLLLLLVVLAAGPAGPAGAVVFTVGTSGTHATVQAAIDAALVSGGDNEVQVQSGTYVENVVIPSDMDSGSLVVSGGWNTAFTKRTVGPSSTLDGGAAGIVLLIENRGGAVQVDGFVIQNGAAPSGGGVSLEPVLTGTAELSNCVVEDNVTERSGGGIFAVVQQSSFVTVRDCAVRGNAVSALADQSVSGGGLQVVGMDEGGFSIHHTVIEENQAFSDGGQVTGGGVFLQLEDASSGDFSDNEIRANESLGAGSRLGSAGALWLISAATGSLDARRNIWADSLSESPDGTEQLFLLATGTSSLLLTDSIVARGSDRGIVALNQDSATIRLTNLTVTDHPGIGIFRSSPIVPAAPCSVYNSIVYQNGGEIDTPGAEVGSNLIGVDPHFVDAAGGDYDLGAPSPARDQGDNEPPGGLGPLDVYGNERVLNGVVDIGAIESLPEPSPAALGLATLAALGSLARRRRPPNRGLIPRSAEGRPSGYPLDAPSTSR
jgi:hypothetical protein